MNQCNINTYKGFYCASCLLSDYLAGNSEQQYYYIWYFVTKIVLIYCEKKLFL